MEVVHVCGLYPPHLGGEELVVQSLARRQAEQGHTVSVYTSKIGGAGQATREHDGLVDVRRLPALALANTPLMPALLWRLLRHRPRPHVVHLHAGHALLPELVALACAVRRVPFVVHIHLLVRRSGPWGVVLLPAYRRVFSYVCRRADAVLCLTEAMRADVVREAAVAPRDVLVVPNGVDPPNVRESTRSETEVLFVGRLAAQKNVALVVEAMRWLPEVQLRVIGDGPDRDGLQALITDLGLHNVRLEGRLSHDKVLEAYACAAVVVLPSTHEGMPLVLLEAMAGGAPVVASALPELLEAGGPALLPVDALTPEAFARAIRMVLSDSRLRESMSRAGVQRASALTWEAAVERVDCIYARVVAAAHS